MDYFFTPNPQEIGHRIREIRKSLGLSMTEFAKRIDDKARSGTISNWETGKNLPNNQRMKKISELGNKKIEELYYGLPSEYYRTVIYTAGFTPFPDSWNDVLSQVKDENIIPLLRAAFDIEAYARYIPHELIAPYRQKAPSSDDYSIALAMIAKETVDDLLYYQTPFYGNELFILNLAKENTQRLFENYTRDNKGIKKLVIDKLTKLKNDQLFEATHTPSKDFNSSSEVRKNISEAFLKDIDDILNRALSDLENLDLSNYS